MPSVVTRLRSITPLIAAAASFSCAVPFAASRVTDSEYNRETIAIMRRVIPPDGTGIDVGAFKGELTEGLLKAAPRGRHWAVEPQPEYAARLRQRFPTVEILELALGDSTGNVSFVQAIQAPARSSLRPQDYPKGEERTREITVRLARLDDVIPDSQRVHLIKADVEGAEYLVFRGARRTLQRWHPVLVFEYGHAGQVQFGVTPAMMWTMLHDELGYDLFIQRGWLEGRSPFTFDEFRQALDNDWMFVAAPRG